MDGPTDSDIAEHIQKAAIDLLITRGDTYASALILSCGLEWEYSGDSWHAGAKRLNGIDLSLTGPPALYQILSDIPGLGQGGRRASSGTAEAIEGALSAAVDGVMRDCYLKNVYLRMATSLPYPGWRDEYLAQVRGDSDPSNQATVASTRPAFTWNGLRFRSKTEMVLSQALSRRGVLYFPLPAAVSKEYKLEPDFLVCSSQGKWGILEVHGDNFHTPTTAADEHERGRWFKGRGVRVFEIFDARQCFNEPDSVVETFLRVLDAS